jgi:hypothetical protein
MTLRASAALIKIAHIEKLHPWRKRPRAKPARGSLSTLVTRNPVSAGSECAIAARILRAACCPQFESLSRQSRLFDARCFQVNIFQANFFVANVFVVNVFVANVFVADVLMVNVLAVRLSQYLCDQTHQDTLLGRRGLSRRFRIILAATTMAFSKSTISSHVRSRMLSSTPSSHSLVASISKFPLCL